jgi:hypothetical protein
MKIREELGQEVDLLRRWVLASGRDVIATTRDSFMSVEGRVGVSVFVALWALGRGEAGAWNVWGGELGGEILPQIRTWYAGGMVLFQAFLLGTHILAGVLWGMIVKNAWGLVGVAWPKTKAERFQPWVVGFITGLLIVPMHTALLLRDLARHPALYQELFIDRGGVAAWVQRFSLSVFSGWGGTAVLLGVGVLGVGGLVRLIQRLVVWFMEFSRPTRVAIGVLGGALVLFACGIRFVMWTQAERNEGPNLLLISVDGLRGDWGAMEKAKGTDALARLIRRSGVKGHLVPPSVDLTPTLATALTGRSPLSHGIRHDFPAEQDLTSDLLSLPAFLRANGWRTIVFADGPDQFLNRIGAGFDQSRVASSALFTRLARRQLERSPHVLPYLSGRVGRWFPLLRGSPFLADPALLAREAVSALKDLQGESKFFLWVHFSSLNPVSVVSSPRGAARLARGRADSYRRPGDGLTDRALTEAEWGLVRRIYEENREDLLGALEVLLKDVLDKRTEGNTAVVLWSPRATLLSEGEEAAARDLKGPAFFDVPFLAVPVPARGGGRWFLGLGRAMDVAPTAARLLGVTPPPEWEGAPLSDGFPEGEAGIIYSETSTPFVRGGDRARTPALKQLLVEDRDSPGHLRLDPAWEDPVLLFRDRAIQMGDERLVYHPGETGVSFEYAKPKGDSPPLKNSVAVRALNARVKDLRDIFYRHLSRESGWRPQNDYWIPEAFLREESVEDSHGN